MSVAPTYNAAHQEDIEPLPGARRRYGYPAAQLIASWFNSINRVADDRGWEDRDPRQWIEQDSG